MFSNNLPLREMSHYGSRPPASCKECRRLKLKCDKKVPCSSCVRRGCASICPTGQMVAKGTRFILANTEELHEKIDTLISRIHSLEGALETSHSQNSNQPHPLLRGELRSVAIPAGSTAPSSDPITKEEELSYSVGNLTLDGHGSRYFGSTGALASIWNEGERTGGPDDPEVKHKEGLPLALAGLPLEIAHMAYTFPIRIPTTENSSQISAWLLENCLPPYAEAWSLFENFWEHYAWHSAPFSRGSFVEQILSPLYHKVPDPGDKPLGHRLALLFMVFAIGQFMDFTKTLDIWNGQRYYMLARASLCLDPVFEGPTITALQAMYLISVYLQMSRGAYEPEHPWILSGINTRLALTLGLQHDAHKFDLPAVEVEARERVLVSVLCFEMWQSLVVGRPPAYTFADFDWVLKRTPSLEPDSSLVSPSWASFYIRDCVGVVMEAAMESRYSIILKTDAKIREYPVPNFKTSNELSGEPLGVSQLMQKTFMGIIKEVSLLFLHRRFFALALARSPNDPLKSPFSQSVLACYRSTVAFLTTFRTVYSIVPAMLQRIWFIWPNVFVGTLVLGSIVARSPGCSLASSALLELEMICQLWETMPSCICSAKVLENVSKLKRKAFMAFSQHKTSKGSFKGCSVGVEVDDEIAALGGAGPRVISSSPKVSASSTNSPAQTSPPTSNPSPSAPTEPVDEPAVSPTLPDLSSFNAAQAFPQAEFASQYPDFTTGTFPTDFGDLFQELGMAGSYPTNPLTGPSVLEELGLCEGWQPVMNDLGL